MLMGSAMWSCAVGDTGAEDVEQKVEVGWEGFRKGEEQKGLQKCSDYLKELSVLQLPE